jgi:hypothetical protein
MSKQPLVVTTLRPSDRRGAQKAATSRTSLNARVAGGLYTHTFLSLLKTSSADSLSSRMIAPRGKIQANKIAFGAGGIWRTEGILLP